jgi:hypothetical protein
MTVTTHRKVVVTVCNNEVETRCCLFNFDVTVTIEHSRMSQLHTFLSFVLLNVVFYNLKYTEVALY